MSGKLMSMVILLCAVLAGGLLYYLQIYGFYTDVADGAAEVTLTARDDDTPHEIPYAAFQAIDAESSPIRYRACFVTSMALDRLDEDFLPYPNAEPRNAPGWFDCFDARAIAAELAAGTARAYLGQKNVAYGVDRIVAITSDGRGYVWHDLNACGDRAYDGTQIGEDCPPRPAPGN